MSGVSMKDIKKEVRYRVHQIATDIDWPHLSLAERTHYYETWAMDPNIGGLLARAVGPDGVRVYLKNSIMKEYKPAQQMTIRQLLASMSLPYTAVTQQFIKPEAVLCDDCALYTLTKAKDWKLALMCSYERACEHSCVTKNVVFVIEHTTGRFVDQSYRDLITSAAKRLAMELHWVV